MSVCLIDSGVDATFPDLRGTTFADGTDLSGQGAADGLRTVDLEGHGTAMAAFIAGAGQSGDRGLLGAAPGASIMSVSIDTAAGGTSVSDAVAYCADHGAEVINISLVGAVDPKAIAYAQARDAVVVAGTGNDGGRESLGDIAGAWGVLAVAGIDRSREIDPRSSAAGAFLLLPDEEPTAGDFGGVGVAAPFAARGDASTGRPGDCPGGVFGPRRVWGADGVLYNRQCGTSISTAVVSGVVALVRAAHPELNAANVVNRIITTAAPPTDGSEPPSPLYGFGVVDAAAAVSADVPPVDANPLGSCFTGSRGVWDPRVPAQRPEPEAHAAPAPAPWQDIVIPDATATTGTTGEDGVGASTGTVASSGIPPILVLVGALVLVLLLVGVLVAVLLARRRAPQPPAAPRPWPPPPSGPVPPGPGSP